MPIYDILSKGPIEGVFPCYNDLILPSVFAVLNILYHAESERACICLKQSLNKFCWHAATACWENYGLVKIHTPVIEIPKSRYMWHDTIFSKS